MNIKKQLGIWLDHSVAHLIELHHDSFLSFTLDAQTGEQDEELNTLDESMIQNKEQDQLSSYFKKLSDVIKDYDEVILFGPTDAKRELFNSLKSDRHFEKIKIEVRSADKMTENQQLAFIKDYFKTTFD